MMKGSGEMKMERKNYFSGSALEEKVGFSRVVSIGPFIHIGGTTSVQPDGTVFGIDSPYNQTIYILEKFIKLLEEAGASAKDVIKVKCYTVDMAYAQEIAKAYSEYFFEVKPLLTIVGISMLNRATQLVEIELEAIKIPNNNIQK